MSGTCYDLCQFPEAPLGENRCPLDGGVLRDAVKSKKCGHVYGMQCILTHLMKKKEACPVCSTPMDVSHLEPAESVRRRVMNLPMACREIDRCDWVGTVAEEPAHVHGPYCGVFMVKCPFCEARVQEGPAFEAHKAVCPEAIVVCEQCYEDMPRKEMAMHLKGLGGRICRLTTPMKRQKEATMAQVRARQEAAERKAKMQQEQEKMERMSFHQSMCGAAGGAGGSTPEPHERSFTASTTANDKSNRPVADHPSIILDEDGSPVNSGNANSSGAKASVHDTTTRVYAVNTPSPNSAAANKSGGGDAEPPAVDTTGSGPSAAAADNDDDADAPPPPSVDSAAEAGEGRAETEEAIRNDPAAFFGQLPSTVDSLQAALFDLTQRHEELERRHYHLQHTVFDLIDYISSRDMNNNNANNDTASSRPATANDAATAPSSTTKYKSVKPMFVPDVAKKAAFDYVFSGMGNNGNAANKNAAPSSANAATPQRQLFGKRGNSPNPARPQHLPPLGSADQQQQQQQQHLGVAKRGADGGGAKQRPMSSPLSPTKDLAMGGGASNNTATTGTRFTEAKAGSNTKNTATGAAGGLKPKAPSAPPTVPEGGYRRAVSVASSVASADENIVIPTATTQHQQHNTKMASAKKPTITISVSTPTSATKQQQQQRKSYNSMSTMGSSSGTSAAGASASSSTAAAHTNKNSAHVVGRQSSSTTTTTIAGHTPSALSATPTSTRKSGGANGSGSTPIQYSHRVGQGKGLKAASPNR